MGEGTLKSGITGFAICTGVVYNKKVERFAQGGQNRFFGLIFPGGEKLLKAFIRLTRHKAPNLTEAATCFEKREGDCNNMKKSNRVLSLLVVACMVLSLAACGGDDAAQGSSSAASVSSGAEQTSSASEEEESSEEPAESEESAEAEEPAEPADGSVTLEDFFNSDTMQAVVEATAEQYEAQGISSTMYAEGNELRYEFTMTSIGETTEEERAVYAEALKAGMETNADAFQSTADQVKSVVSNDEVVVVVTYLDGAGNVLYTQSFSSSDAA